MEEYRLIGRIGEGAHGVVFRAQHVPSGHDTALKKVNLGKVEEGIPNTALREIKSLQTIEEHENIVSLLDFFPNGAGFIMVFEYMASDLAELLRSSLEPLPEALVKSYMLMLLSGIGQSGQLKIADFGQARVLYKPHHPGGEGERLYSHQVATRWYRAPELLYGACVYDEGVDLWAVGCILGELINHSPLFPGENDINQLFCVTHALGTPDLVQWPELQTLPDYNKIIFEVMPKQPTSELVPEASPTVIDLLEHFLQYRSCNRVRADQAGLHPFFFEEPLPTHRSELPAPPPRKSAQPRLFDQRCRLVSPSLLDWDV